MIDSQALSITMPTDREVVIRRTFHAPRRTVFEAWTNPDYVPRWMTGQQGWTMPTCEIDLNLGGKWRFVWHQPDGGSMIMQGVYQEILPPERLVWTEVWGEGPEALSTVELSEDGPGTTMTFTKLYSSREARDFALKGGMGKGVSVSFDNLARFLVCVELCQKC